MTSLDSGYDKRATLDSPRAFPDYHHCHSRGTELNSAPKKRILFALKACISLLLIVVIVRKVDVSAVGRIILDANWGVLAFAFSLLFVATVVTALRWQTLLKALEHSQGFGFLWRSFLAGFFLSNFLPSTVGGDALRMYDSWREGATRANAIAAVVMDRIMGSFALLLFACAGLYLGHEFIMIESEAAQSIAYIALAGLVCLVALVTLPAIFDKQTAALIAYLPGFLKKAGDSYLRTLRSFRSQRGALAVALGYSIALQSVVVLYHFTVGYGLGFDVSMGAYFLIVPIAVVIMMIPISINGIGVREGVFVALLATQGVSQAEGLAFAWVVYLFLVLQSSVGGIILAFRGESSRELDFRSSY